MLNRTPRWDGTVTAIQRTGKTSVILIYTRVQLLAMHVVENNSSRFMSTPEAHAAKPLHSPLQRRI